MGTGLRRILTNPLLQTILMLAIIVMMVGLRGLLYGIRPRLCRISEASSAGSTGSSETSRTVTRNPDPV